MRNSFLLLVGWLFLLIIPIGLIARNDYPNHQQLSERLQRLARQNPQLAKLQSLGKTAGNKDIWLVSLGAGNLANRPAIAIVAGVPGNHLLGTEITLQFMEEMLATAASDAAARSLLDSVTFYIFPDMNPDAREQYFRPIRYERFGNANPSDLDRDGKIGEDPYNDLNGDGLITMMRVKDPTGSWMPHPQDERIMVKARPEKGEKGSYLLFSEGIDQDKDGQFNEDGEEGVFFNRNFTFKHPHFTRGAGEHAVSEAESRAIADFLFSAKNVFSVITFGPANNLSEPIRYNEREAGGRIPTGWQESDVAVNQMVSLLYNNAMKDPGSDTDNGNSGEEDAATEHEGDEEGSTADAGHMVDLTSGKGVPGSDGDFFQWAYFHYGRLSFSTPGWWIPTASNKGATPSSRQQGESPESHELDFIRWAGKHGLTNVFVPWTRVDHPDFPDREVEVGGMTPFVMGNPPYHLAEVIAEKHMKFILEIAAKRPRTDIVNLKTETLGNNLFRITAEVINKGHFPSVSEMGKRNRWVQKVVIRPQLASNQQMISGKMVEVVDLINGRSSIERSWLVRGKGNMIIRAGSESTGFKEITVAL